MADDPFAGLAVGLSEDTKAKAKAPRGKAAREAAKAHLSGEATETAGAISGAIADGAAAGIADAAQAALAPAEDESGKAEAAPSDADGADGATATADAPSDATGPAIPAAPGDDAEAVMARRLDRLTAIAEEADFESGTALGDLVECLVDLFKHRPKVWSAMSQDEQKTTVKHVETTCKAVLRKVVQVVAEEDSVAIAATFLGNFTVKGDAIEAKLKIESVDGDVLMQVHRTSGHRVVVISADDKRFSGRRRDVATEPDQVSMRFADDAPVAPREITSAPPAPPADDSDLAGEEDGDVADEAEAERFGVFDPSSGEYLIDEGGGDDGWTDAESDAGRWTEAKATDIARGFAPADGEKPLEVRELAPVASSAD